MGNLELSLLMFLPPILFLVFYLELHSHQQRVSTTILGRKGRVVGTTPTHLLISFDDGLTDWHRTELCKEVRR
jgi:hypothetical protein